VSVFYFPSQIITAFPHIKLRTKHVERGSSVVYSEIYFTVNSLQWWNYIQH